MSEEGQPFLGNCLGVVALFVGDGFEGKQIEGHTPGQVEVPGGGDEVGNVACGFSCAVEHYGLHVARVAGEDNNGYAGDNFLIAFQELHLAA